MGLMHRVRVLCIVAILSLVSSVAPTLSGVMLAGAGLALPSASAQAGQDKKKQESSRRRVASLSEPMFKKLARIQEKIDAKNYAEAMEDLSDMNQNRRLNAYERATIANTQAFVSFSQEDYTGAIRYYMQLLQWREEIPEALVTGTLYALGQLYFVQEDYIKALDYLDQWFAVADNPGPMAYIFKAQGLYQLQRFSELPAIVETAMEVARQREQPVRESWWLLLRAAYYELENWDKVIEILEILVADFPQKDYWVQLSGIYGQEGREQEQVAAIWLAYVQGYLNQEREILNVVGLMLQEEVPYWAARMLEEEMEKGVVEESVDNLRMLAQAWQLSQEVDRAIPVYQQAAAKSDEGELYFQLAQLYHSKDDCSEAVDAADKAFEKGALKQPARAHLIKGMCQYEQKQFVEAIESFGAGQRIARRQEQELELRSLNQWKLHVQKEHERYQQLAEARKRLNF